jgi:hypothetical protein
MLICRRHGRHMLPIDPLERLQRPRKLEAQLPGKGLMKI